MHFFKEKYPSVFSVILPQIELLLSHSCSQYLLHLGDIELPVFQFKSFPHQLYLTEKTAQYVKPDVYSSLSAFPFDSDSIDAILTPYLPNYERSCRDTIQELLRILKPNGYLFVLGIPMLDHPSITSFERKKGSYRRLSNIYTICREIKQAGGIVTQWKYFFDDTRLPSTSNRMHRFLRKWVRLLWPTEQHYYFIIAKKKVEPLQMLPLSEPAMPYPIIKSNAYAKN